MSRSDSSVDDGAGGDGGTSGGGEIMLFGVRVKVDPMRKSVSMNNLSQYVQPQESSNVAADVSAAGGGGYASADEAVRRRGRKRGVPWTEDEHKLFLLGLQKVGKGDWRGISRNFVKTRTPTQVASHAQKYFIRRNNLNRCRRRSSLFDMTTELVTPTPMEEEEVRQESRTQKLLSPTQQPPPLESSNISGSQVQPFPVTVAPVLIPVQIENPMGKLTLGRQVDQLNHQPAMLLRPVPVLHNPNASTMVDSSPLCLKLSLSLDHNQLPRHSLFPVMSSFNNGDNIISAA